MKMNITEPKEVWLSIIVPVYNTEISLLERCLKSIQKITLPIEILIVDDGSEKFISEFVNNYYVTDNRIKYIYKNNGGVSSARNVGISHASGKYIMFVDSDDELSPEIDSVLSGAFECFEDWIIFNFAYMDEKGKYSEHSPFKEDKVLSIEDLLDLLVPKNKLCEVWAKLIRRSVLIDNGILFPKNYDQGEDVLFNLKLINVIKTCRYVNKVAYLYYIDFERQDIRRLNNLNKTMNNKLSSTSVIKEIIDNNCNENSKNSFYDKLSESQINSLGSNIVALYRYKKMNKTNKQICKTWRKEIYSNNLPEILKFKSNRTIVYALLLKFRCWFAFRFLGFLRRKI